MKILFADKFQAAYLDDLKARGHECDLQPDLGAEDLFFVPLGLLALLDRDPAEEVLPESVGVARHREVGIEHARPLAVEAANT